MSYKSKKRNIKKYLGEIDMSGWNRIKGHGNIKKYLAEAIEKDDIFHACMISGEDGSGKLMIANTFAEALLCENRLDRPCLACDSCKKALAGSHPDILYVTHEKPGSISVDEVRDQLVIPMSVRPYYGRYKIFIINDAHLMTPQAQNALLKTLEEPPEYGVIILLTENESLMLHTILSRVVKLHCGAVPKETIKNHLIEEYKISDYKAEICAVFAQGNIGKAISMASMEEFYATRDAAVTLAKIIPSTDVFDIIARIKEIAGYKDKIEKYLDFLFVWYHDVLLFKATANADYCLFRDEFFYIKNQAEMASYRGLERILKAITNARLRLKANVKFDLVMELLFMTIKESFL